MDDYILISWLNDFIFCPVSIYFHQLYGSKETLLYQNRDQISGKAAHKTVDEKSYSTRKDVLQGISVVSEKYGLMGKIDIFDVTKGVLTERKKRIVNMYGGYVFQLYAQYFALMEMGYIVSRIRFHSLDDNKNYDIQLPSEDHMMRVKMVIISYDIKDDKLRTKFNKYIRKFGGRLQYSVYEISNSDTVLDNIILEIKSNFEKKFSEEDSIMIMKFSKYCDITRFGYAKHDTDELIIV